MRNLGNGLRTGDCLWEASKGNGKSLDDLDLIWFHFLKVFLNSASDAMKEQPAEQVGCCFRHWKARIVEDIIRKLGLKLGSLSILAICILCGSVSPCWIWSVGLGIWWPDLVSLIENGLWWTVFELFGGKICMGLAPFWVYGSWFWHLGFEDSKKARGHLGIDLLFSSLNLLSCFLGVLMAFSGSGSWGVFLGSWIGIALRAKYREGNACYSDQECGDTIQDLKEGKCGWNKGNRVTDWRLERSG